MIARNDIGSEHDRLAETNSVSDTFSQKTFFQDSSPEQSLSGLSAHRNSLLSAINTRIVQRFLQLKVPDWVDTVCLVERGDQLIVKLNVRKPPSTEEFKRLEEDARTFFKDNLKFVVVHSSVLKARQDVLANLNISQRGKEAREMEHFIERSAPQGVELYQMRFFAVRDGNKLKSVGVLQINREAVSDGKLVMWRKALEHRFHVDLHFLHTPKIQAFDLTHLPTIMLDSSTNIRRPEDALSAQRVEVDGEKELVFSRFFIDGSWQDLVGNDFPAQAKMYLALKYSSDTIIPLPDERDRDESMFRLDVPQFAWAHITQHSRRGELKGEWIGRAKVKCDRLFVGEQFANALRDLNHPMRPLFKNILEATRVLIAQSSRGTNRQITARNALGTIVSEATRSSYAAIADLSSQLGLEILYRVWRPFDQKDLSSLIGSARSLGLQVNKRDFLDSRRLSSLREQIALIDPELLLKIETAFRGPTYTPNNEGHIGEGLPAFTTLKLRKEAGEINQHVLTRSGIGSGISLGTEPPAIIKAS